MKFKNPYATMLHMHTNLEQGHKNIIMSCSEEFQGISFFL